MVYTSIAPEARYHFATTRLETTREERKGWSLVAIKIQGTKRSGEGGRRARYVTPDLSYDYVEKGEKRGAKIMNRTRKQERGVKGRPPCDHG